MASPPALKRRRVARACDSCRALKARCDGNQPSCGRCTGYGYFCRWEEADGRKKGLEGSRVNLDLLSMDTQGQKLMDAILTYDNLIRDLRKNLSADDCKMVDLRLASIQLPSHSTKQIESGDNSSLDQQVAGDQQSISVRRYLGEASDIRFFHAIEATFGQEERETSEAQVDSYEQDGTQPRASEQGRGGLPPRTAADKFVNIYFATIHLAYPFISEPDFRAKYEKLWQSQTLDGFRGPWLSILLTIFALGSCYERIAESKSEGPVNPNSLQDVRYFEHAVAISQRHTSKHTVEHVSALLAQSFYLLATCQTDQCWITLGLAARIAQSIGLHVEEGSTSRGDATSSRETNRRVWYSVFVLDRLLALQLGRPPLIGDDDFNVEPPSRQSDVDLVDSSDPKQGWVGDYFVAMIKFSEIIGRVYYNLYAPKKSGDIAVTLSNIDLLDSELLQWRSSLSRKLRFDLSHVFESSRSFQSQRNMLAVKFYNLRALIHRPLLSPAKLTSAYSGSTTWYQGEYHRISMSKRKCVEAAQQTAKLLHKLEDKKSLVYGFPWWQMISCLICASSILFVASRCINLNSESEVEIFKDIDWLAVDEDAEVCLQVFQALSSNSNAARLARDMMQRLKNSRTIYYGNGLDSLSSASVPTAVQNATETTSDDPMPTDAFGVSMPSQLDFGVPSQEALDLMFQSMYYEASEPVMWSAQFVNEFYDLDTNHPNT